MNANTNNNADADTSNNTDAALNRSETRPNQPKFFLVRLPLELADTLEDFKHERQRRERRWIPKRELVEEAIRLLVAQQTR